MSRCSVEPVIETLRPFWLSNLVIPYQRGVRTLAAFSHSLQFVMARSDEAEWWFNAVYEAVQQIPR